MIGRRRARSPRGRPLRLRRRLPLPPSVMPEGIPGGRIRRVDGDRVTKAGERRVDLAEIALQLAEPLADRWRRSAAAGGRTCKAAIASPGRRSRRHRSASSTASGAPRGFCFRPSRTIASAASRSTGRQTRVGPPRPRLFEQRRTPRRLLEMRGGAIGALHAQPATARDTGAPRSSRSRWPISSSNARAAAA